MKNALDCFRLFGLMAVIAALCHLCFKQFEKDMVTYEAAHHEQKVMENAKKNH